MKKPLLSKKTASRMAELDRVLDITPGQGIAETVLSNLLEDIRDGEHGIMDAWDWEDRAAALAALEATAERWRQEDAQEPAGKEVPA